MSFGENTRVNKVKSIKIYIVVFSATILLLVALRGIYYEQNTCLGIPLIKESELLACSEELEIDFAEITFNGISVAADEESKTIYISQSSKMISRSSNLQGTLGTNNPKQELYFLKDAHLQNLKETVNNAEYITLVVVEGDVMSKIKVAISTLPIISLDGECLDEYTHKWVPIYTGDLTVFAGENSATGKMNTETYSAKWRVRGGKSANLNKKPQKISLKKENGENLNADLLGMGADDDWILNPMNLDDTKVKEKTAIDLWNSYIMDSTSDYPMSTSQYVEVVIDGKYQGLYLLQRRLDTKFLGLDKERDIIFKGRPTWVAPTLYEGYEIVHSPYDELQTYYILQEYLLAVDETNYINVNTFLHFLSAVDNVGYKNMYYILKQDESGRYTMYLLPWDTDISMGVIPNIGSPIHAYDYDISMNQYCKRMYYYNVMLEYTDLDDKMAERWYELREDVFCTGGAWEQLLEENTECIQKSGAMARDYMTYGYIYEGKDTIENLFKWSKEKSELIDAYWEEICK